MKRKVLLSLLLVLSIFIITGCGVSNNSSGKNYDINGVSFKLDKVDSTSKMKYKISKSFDKRAGASTTTYTLYHDASKDKYDVSNIVLSISVTANIMETESNIEYDINKLNNNSSLKNITREKKTINDITWEYITLDNYYETNTNNYFKNHSYYYETYDGKYYTTYIISFNKADNIEEIENDFLNSIIFE